MLEEQENNILQLIRC